jgi:hypothetical protein
MREKAIQQINSVVSIILNKSIEEGVTYDIYGSLRTGFAILHHSDADISINFKNQK